jgi:hypothetical protein
MVFDYMPREGTEATVMNDLFYWWRRASLDGPKSEGLPVVSRMLQF